MAAEGSATAFEGKTIEIDSLVEGFWKQAFYHETKNGGLIRYRIHCTQPARSGAPLRASAQKSSGFHLCLHVPQEDHWWGARMHLQNQADPRLQVLGEM